MADRGGGYKEADTEEIMRRKFHMKCLFRALGRLVKANAYWLIEASEQYEGVEDVKRRVEQAVRSKGNKKQLLSINDKSLLNKPADQRTDQEKKYLYRIIGGLKCFKRYPNNVKKKLAAVTYFKYYGPGRTIVREQHEAHALYFIVSGDVIVTQMFYDDLLQQYISAEVGDMHHGDMFGEVSLLHNIPRTATVTTTGHCELLALMKDDFKNVLQASVQKQWDDIKRVMSAFSYFDTYDEVAKREGCLVAKMKTYAANETLIGDGVGVQNFVYFLLTGKCQMIESIQVLVTTHLGRNYYSMIDPCLTEEQTELDLGNKYLSLLKTGNNENSISEATGSIHDIQRRKYTTVNTRRGSSKDVISEVRQPSVLSKKLANQGKRPSCTTSDGKKVACTEEENEIGSPESEDMKSRDLLKPIEVDPFRSSIRISLPNTQTQVIENLRTYFMQVCQFNPGSSFGFGENMQDRRIVALTSVSCMLLPKVWLLQRNSANIWTRIKHYLDKKILTKKQLFEKFVLARRWTEYHNQLVTDIVARSKVVNPTSIHDVPYSIRMEEMIDL